MAYLDPRELNELAALAARGGIGEAVALCDCVAEAPDQLMYIKDDRLVLLRDLGAVLLASCEGVVGWVHRDHVSFTSLAGTSSSPISSPQRFKTVVVAPSPPAQTQALPDDSPLDDVDPERNGALGQLDTDDVKERSPYRASGPFDLETPQYSPALEEVSQDPFSKDKQADEKESVEKRRSGDSARSGEWNLRQSTYSTASSDALGGIGGFMMGSGRDSVGAESLEELKVEDSSVAHTSVETPWDHTPLRRVQTEPRARSPTSPAASEDTQRSDDWDIYGDYARDSLYGGKRQSLASKRGTLQQNGEEITFHSLAALRDIPDKNVSSVETPPRPPRRRPVALDLGTPKEHSDTVPVEEPTTPKTGNKSLDSETIPLSASSPPHDPQENQSVAQLLRLRLQKQMSREHLSTPATEQVPEVPTPETQSARPPPTDHAQPPLEDQTVDSPASPGIASEAPRPLLRIANASSDSEPSPVDSIPSATTPVEAQPMSRTSSSDRQAESDNSTILETPQTASEDHLNHPVIPSHAPMIAPDESNTLLASPIPLDTSPKLMPPEETSQFLSPAADTLPTRTNSSLSPRLVPPPPPTYSPSLSPNPDSSPNLNANPRLSPYSASPSMDRSRWSPGSQASPHSVQATKHAVEAHRSTPETKRPRGLTLVGRIDADLSASRGPVPITFLVGGPGMPTPLPSANPNGIGLGLPSSVGLSPRPQNPERRATSPNANPRPPTVLENPLATKDATGRYPTPVRSVTSPPPELPQGPPSSSPRPQIASSAGPNAKSSMPASTSMRPAPPAPPVPAAAPLQNRPRARSFSAAMAKTLGRKKEQTPPPPALKIDTAITRIQPTAASPAVPGTTSARKLFGRKSETLPTPLATAQSAQPEPWVPPPIASPTKSSIASPTRLANGLPRASVSTVSLARGSTSTASLHHALPSGASATFNLPNDSNHSLPAPPSARSSSFSFTSKSSKTPRKASRVLPSPVSHKDFLEETVKADGMDFELVQPRKNPLSPLSPGGSTTSVDSPTTATPDKERPGLTRHDTMATLATQASAGSMRILAETDEWGFLKDKSPTPEIFQSRAAGADTRIMEQKWLGIIASPLPAGSAPSKKVKKLVIENGVPGSLRGKVWAWFLSGQMSARRPGLYQELLEHDNGKADEQIERDVASAYPDHSIFSEPTSPGFSDLRSILRAYSNFAPCYRTEMALIGGAMLIHCVAEEAFWLLGAFVNGVLREYYSKDRTGLRIDASVFAGVLWGSEPKLARLFRDVGVQPLMFLDKWFSQLFIRVLPWPTALRVIDAVVSEGPRFLMVASLTVLTLSRDRLLALPRKHAAVLGYLRDLPQDSLVLPETFMKACENVKFKEEDLKRLRTKVEQEIMR